MILCGDVLTMLAAIKDETIQCVVTSPPYWGLRDYGTAKWEGGAEGCDHKPRMNPRANRPRGISSLQGGTATVDAAEIYKSECLKCGAIRNDVQIGLESTPEAYVEKLVQVFREVRRVLRKDGTCWLNLGDSYAGSAQGWGHDKQYAGTKQSTNRGSLNQPLTEVKIGFQRPPGYISSRQPNGLKPKDLVGIPWRVAFALQADGWWLRSDIIWAKANCMPESVTDRPTRSHEYIFLLTKSARYYYDADAIKEPALYDVDGTGTAARKARQLAVNKSMPTTERAGIRPAGLKDAAMFDGKHGDKQRGHSRRHDGFNDRWDLMSKEDQCTGYRNKRDVWTVSPARYPEAHFATFPEKLVEPCILAGSKVGDVVLDPFAGSGTVLAVAQRFGRKAVSIELNPDYVTLIRKRIEGQTLALAL